MIATWKHIRTLLTRTVQAYFRGIEYRWNAGALR